MNPALRDAPDALRVNLRVPSTAVRLGPFAFDGINALLGVDLDDVLAPLMVGAKHQRAILGVVVDVYPLAIPDGEGLEVPVKLLGALGFYNLRGLLVLVMRPAVAEALRGQLASELGDGTAAGPRSRESEGDGIVAEFAVRLRAVMRKAVPVGSWGEVGVEAA